MKRQHNIMCFFRSIVGLGLILAANTGSSQTLKLDIGSVRVFDTPAAAGSFCVQVPIYLTNTGVVDLVLESFAFTLKTQDSNGLIEGGITREMLISNAFIPGGSPGISDPGVDLSNSQSGTGSPTCLTVFNPATNGAAESDFSSGMASLVFVQNNFQNAGWVRATVLNIGGSFVLSTILSGETYLIGVLEIPFINPDTSLFPSVLISATTTSEDPTGNAYVISAVPRSQAILIDELFDISEATATVKFGGIFENGFEQ